MPTQTEVIRSSKTTWPRGDGHDGLHMKPPLANCWCMCPKCWQPYPTTSKGNRIGRCVCPQCPCNNTIL